MTNNERATQMVTFLDNIGLKSTLHNFIGEDVVEILVHPSKLQFSLIEEWIRLRRFEEDQEDPPFRRRRKGANCFQWAFIHRSNQCENTSSDTK